PAYFLQLVFAVNIPKHQRHFPAVGLHYFFVDLYSNGRVIRLGVNAFDETPDQAGLADGKRPDHADFLLQHRAKLRMARARGHDSKGHAAVELARFLSVFRSQGLCSGDSLCPNAPQVDATLGQLSSHPIRAALAQRAIRRLRSGAVAVTDDFQSIFSLESRSTLRDLQNWRDKRFQPFQLVGRNLRAAD